MAYYIVIGDALLSISIVVFEVESKLTHVILKLPDSGVDDGDIDGNTTDAVDDVSTPANKNLVAVGVDLCLMNVIV
jgi:hypothetical protein